MNQIDKAFGIAVRQKRLEMKLSQEDLSFRAGLHRTYISQIERGIKSPSLKVVSVLSKSLALKMHELILLAEEITEDQSVD